MADYQLNQTGPTVQQAIDKALAIEAQLQQEANTRAAADNLRATKTELQQETARAQAAEAQLASASDITAEIARATSAESALGSRIDSLNQLVPIAATPSNQLADKAFVNSSIQSNTASLVTDNGQPFGTVTQLRQVTANENDYAYVTVSGSGGTYYDRYKYSNGQWAFEYRVNSTVFTAAQWGAINSNITAALTTKLNGLPDAYNALTTTEINTICV